MGAIRFFSNQTNQVKKTENIISDVENKMLIIEQMAKGIIYQCHGSDNFNHSDYDKLSILQTSIETLEKQITGIKDSVTERITLLERI